MTRKKDLSSWQDFERELEKIQSEQQSNKHLMRRLLFRGQSDANWPLTTTLERQTRTETTIEDYVRRIAYLRPEVETLTQNRWDIPDHREITGSFADYDSFRFSPVLQKMYGYMVHLRHHGFPSPLLDWTRSARVAAYFAFADTSNDKRVSIYVLSEARMHSGSSNKPQILSLGRNVKTHRRHFLQQCEYTMCGVYKNGPYKNAEWWFADHGVAFEDRSESEQWPINFANYQFTLPGSERFKVLEMLDRDNINAFSLFGSEDSLMETLALREFHFPDPYIGADRD